MTDDHTRCGRASRDYRGPRSYVLCMKQNVSLRARGGAFRDLALKRNPAGERASQNRSTVLLERFRCPPGVGDCAGASRCTSDDRWEPNERRNGIGLSVRSFTFDVARAVLPKDVCSSGGEEELPQIRSANHVSSRAGYTHRA